MLFVAHGDHQPSKRLLDLPLHEDESVCLSSTIVPTLLLFYGLEIISCSSIKRIVKSFLKKIRFALKLLIRVLGTGLTMYLIVKDHCGIGWVFEATNPLMEANEFFSTQVVRLFSLEWRYRGTAQIGMWKSTSRTRRLGFVQRWLRVWRWCCPRCQLASMESRSPSTGSTFNQKGKGDTCHWFYVCLMV